MLRTFLGHCDITYYKALRPVPLKHIISRVPVAVSSVISFWWIVKLKVEVWHSSFFLHKLAPCVVLISSGLKPATLGLQVKWLNHWATEEPLYSHSPGRSNSAELLQYSPSSWGNRVFATVEWVAVQMSYFALLPTPRCFTAGRGGWERFCEAACSITWGSPLWHSSFSLHKLPPWIMLLSAGFEPATFGLQVKWLNHWATEEPVYSYSLGRSNTAELLQYILLLYLNRKLFLRAFTTHDHLPFDKPA